MSSALQLKQPAPEREANRAILLRAAGKRCGDIKCATPTWVARFERNAANSDVLARPTPLTLAETPFFLFIVGEVAVVTRRLVSHILRHNLDREHLDSGHGHPGPTPRALFAGGVAAGAPDRGLAGLLEGG